MTPALAYMMRRLAVLLLAAAAVLGWLAVTGDPFRWGAWLGCVVLYLLAVAMLAAARPTPWGGWS